MTLSDLVPTLMTSSSIYRLSAGSGSSGIGRPATVAEYLAIQCVPVLLPEGHPLAEFSDGSKQIKHFLGLTLAEARRLTGNGMNLAQVGSIILFVLATISRPR